MDLIGGCPEQASSGPRNAVVAAAAATPDVQAGIALGVQREGEGSLLFLTNDTGHYNIARPD